MDWLLHNPIAFILVNAGTVAAVLGLVGKYIVRPARWMESVEKDLEALKDSAKATEKNFAWVESVNKDLEMLKAAAIESREDIKWIMKNLPVNSLSERSPLCLTEMGERISAKIGPKEWAALLVAVVQNAVAGMDPYGIQEYCLDYTRRTLELTAEQERKVNAVAYENGIDRNEVLWVSAIVLRDTLLERNGHPVPKRGADSASA